MDAEDAYLTQQLILAERLGWTLDYIDGLDEETYRRVLGTLDGIDKARARRNK